MIQSAPVASEAASFDNPTHAPDMYSVQIVRLAVTAVPYELN